MPIELFDRVDYFCRSNSYISYDSALINSKKIGEILDYMEESLNLTLNNLEVLDVEKDVIERAGEMFLYLFHCPEELWNYVGAWTKFIIHTMKTKPLRIILLHLNNLKTKYETRKKDHVDLTIGKDIVERLMKFLRSKGYVLNYFCLF